jgi:hypothetical protein
VSCAGDPDGGGRGNRPRPGEVSVDYQVAIALRTWEEVRRGHAGVVEDHFCIRRQAVALLSMNLHDTSGVPRSP